MRNLLFFLVFTAAMASCVTKKVYTELQKQCNAKDSILVKTRGELNEANRSNTGLESDLKGSQNQIRLLEGQITDLKSTNNNLLERVSELSKMGQTGLETLKQQNKFIQDLSQKLQQKDSLNLILATNLKRSLDDVNDPDIDVNVVKGVVYISIADKLLFKSGSSEINPGAASVLSKVAKVINDHKDLDVLVEGHTDNRPISTSCLKDNWDLSAMRATSVVRWLQTKYAVAPERMTAGGRSQYVPKEPNDTEAGRAVNRRTNIIITPKLDQFYELLQAEKDKK